MISATTYLYRDMIGWYPELIQGHFLDNFSIRDSFVKETLRRTDYRFFPLGHQDLHILSWFTIQIKTWMLFSAAELIGIVLLSTRFISNQENNKVRDRNPSTLLLITTLLLFHPSTGTAFFQVTYCERMLCLIFALYLTSYQNYRHERTQASSKI